MRNCVVPNELPMISCWLAAVQTVLTCLSSLPLGSFGGSEHFSDLDRMITLASLPTIGKLPMLFNEHVSLWRPPVRTYKCILRSTAKNRDSTEKKPTPNEHSAQTKFIVHKSWKMEYFVRLLHFPRAFAWTLAQFHHDRKKGTKQRRKKRIPSFLIQYRICFVP